MSPALKRLIPTLALIFAAGCAGGSEDPALPQSPGGNAQMGDQPQGGDGGGEAQPDPENPAVPSARQLVIDGALSRLASFNQRVALPVYYLDAQDAPVAGQRIRGRLLDAPGGLDLGPTAEGSGLRSASVTTDADGRAVFDLVAGAAETQFTLEASADGAAPVYWTITVGAAAGGDLRVIIEAPAGPLDHTYVALHNAPGCDAFAAGAAPTQRVGPVALQPVSTSVTVDQLADGAQVSVGVTGHDASGQAIASGCVDAVQVKAGQETVVRVSLATTPLTFGGQFQMIHRFDLTRALGESAILGTLKEIGNGDTSAGNALVGLLCDNIDLNEVLCIALRAVGGGLIDNYVANQLPQSTLDGLVALGDLYDAVADLTVEGQMTLDPPSGDRLIGDQRWTDLTFQWRDGCPFRDPSACTNTFSMADLEVPGGAVVGSFTATVTGADQLTLDPHLMPLPYGTAVRVAAEQWVLPAALGQGGPVTVEDLMGQLVPCATLAANVPVLTVGFCEDTLVPALADLVYEQFTALNPGLEGMTLSGTVTATDSDGDRRMDGLAGGIWDAVVDGLGEIAGTFNSVP